MFVHGKFVLAREVTFHLHILSYHTKNIYYSAGSFVFISRDALLSILYKFFLVKACLLILLCKLDFPSTSQIFEYLYKKIKGKKE
jgi:hypothetical protein